MQARCFFVLPPPEGSRQMSLRIKTMGVLADDTRRKVPLVSAPRSSPIESRSGDHARASPRRSAKYEFAIPQ